MPLKVPTLGNRKGGITKLVYELRYRHGFEYLDRCGRTINDIQRDDPNWIVPDANPQGGSLINLDTSCSLNISALEFRLSIDQGASDPAVQTKSVEDVARHADFVYKTVREHYGLDEFTREGFRVWFIFGESTRKGAREFLKSLDLFVPSEKFTDAFGGEAESVKFAVTHELDDRKMTSSFASIERTSPFDIGGKRISVPPHMLHKDQQEAATRHWKRRKVQSDNPAFGVMVDMDFFQDYPKVVSPSNFIVSSYQLATDRLTSCG